MRAATAGGGYTLETWRTSRPSSSTTSTSAFERAARFESNAAGSLSRPRNKRQSAAGVASPCGGRPSPSARSRSARSVSASPSAASSSAAGEPRSADLCARPESARADSGRAKIPKGVRFAAAAAPAPQPRLDTRLRREVLVPAPGLAAERAYRRPQCVGLAVRLEEQQPALGADRVVEEPVQGDRHPSRAAAFALRPGRDRGTDRGPLLQPQELGRRQLCRPLPTPVDTLLVVGEAVDGDGAVGGGLGRARPRVRLASASVTAGQREEGQAQGGVRAETHAAFVPSLC